MSKILVFGHQNPDTDAINSAITLANLINELGGEAEAVALGEVNPETQFALDKFNHAAPRIIGDVSKEAEKVILVDHNELQQSAEGIRDVEIIAVVDNHRVANFETANPLYIRMEPIGCTATLVKKLYDENNVEITPQMAGLMVSAIISDTLLFKSPISTDEDLEISKELAEIAGVNLEEYGLELLKAGADTASKSAYDIIEGDAKSFEMGGKKLRIGQVNVVDTDEVTSRKDEVIEAMKAEIADKGYDQFILIITDILENDSVAIIEADDYSKFEKAFNKKVIDQMAELPGVVSRKKQVIPPLTQAFEG